MRLWQTLGLRRNPFAELDDRDWLSLFIQRPSVPAAEDLFRQGAHTVVQLCGPSGTGKTSLLQAVCQYARRHGYRAVYLGNQRPLVPSTLPPWDLVALEEPDLFWGRRAASVVAAIARNRGLVRRLLLSCHRPIRLPVPTMVVRLEPWTGEELRLLYQRRVLHAGGTSVALPISDAAAERLATLVHGNARVALWTLYETFQIQGLNPPERLDPWLVELGWRQQSRLDRP